MLKPRSLLKLLKEGTKEATQKIRNQGGRPEPRRAKPEPAPPGTPETAKTVSKPEGTVPAVDQPAPQKTDAVALEVTPKINEPSGTAAEESERILKSNLGDFDPKRSEMPNFDVVTGEDDMKALIGSVADENAERINAARRGKVSDEQLRAETEEQILSYSEETGIPSDTIRAVMERKFGEPLEGGAKAILGSRIILEQSANRILNFAKKIRAGTANDIEKRQFRRQLAFHTEFQTQWMGARAETGRMLRAFGLPTEGDKAAAQEFDKVVSFYQRMDVDKIAAQLEHVDTIQGVGNYSDGLMRSKREAWLRELFVGSILSGPRTAMVNILGNAGFLAMNTAERAVAGRVGQARALMRQTITGEKMTPDEQALVGEAQAMVFGMTSAFSDALRLAGKAFKAGGDPERVVKFDTGIPKAISAEFLELSGWWGRTVDYLGVVARFPMERVLAPADAGFKVLAQRAELARQAYRNAFDAATVRPELTDREITNMIATDIAQPLTRELDSADAFKVYGTFQAPLGEIGTGWQNAIARTPYMSFIAPFIRTPTNLFKAAFLERSPVAMATNTFKQTLKKGGPEADLMKAQMGMGTATMLLVGMAAESGAITGGGPTNPEAREVLRATGWQPYSFLLPNGKYISYARAEPVAFLMGATADFVETAQAVMSQGEPGDADLEKASNVFMALLTSTIKNTSSKTFVQGLTDFAEVITDTQRYGPQWGARMISGLTPASSFRRQLALADDPILREAVTGMEKFKKGMLPSFSENAPPRLDIFGDVQHHPNGGWMGLFLPTGVTEETKDWWKLELRDVQLASEIVPITSPPSKIQGIQLDAVQMHRYKDLSRNLYEPKAGTKLVASVPGFDGKLKVRFDGNFDAAIKQTMTSDMYRLATPETKAAMLRTVQKKYDEAAAAILVEENVQLSADIATRKMRNNAALGLDLETGL